MQQQVGAHHKVTMQQEVDCRWVDAEPLVASCFDNQHLIMMHNRGAMFMQDICR